MSKLIKCLSVFAVMMIGLLTLASCKDSDSFYETWVEAGAEIEEDHIFEVITVDKAIEMKDNNKSFIVFVGSSLNPTTVSEVSSIQYDAENMNYEGKVYLIDVTEKSSITDRKDVMSKLNIDLDKTASLIAICYDNGSQVFETSRPNSDCDRFTFDDVLSIRAVAAYAFEYYPVEAE